MNARDKYAANGLMAHRQRYAHSNATKLKDAQTVNHGIERLCRDRRPVLDLNGLQWDPAQLTTLKNLADQASKTYRFNEAMVFGRVFDMQMYQFITGVVKGDQTAVATISA